MIKQAFVNCGPLSRRKKGEQSLRSGDVITISVNVKYCTSKEGLLGIHYIIAPDNEIKDLVYYKGKTGNARIDLISKRYTNGDEFEIYVSIIK